MEFVVVVLDIGGELDATECAEVADAEHHRHGPQQWQT
jgi:hypothetical protein